MLRDRAKSAAAEAAPHDVHRKTNHFPGWDFGDTIVRAIFIGIDGVRTARIRQIKYGIHFGCGKWNGWRRDPDIARGHSIAMRLHQTASVARIGL